MFCTSIGTALRRALSFKASLLWVAGLTAFYTSQAFAGLGTPPVRGVGCSATHTENYASYNTPGWERMANYPNNRQKMIIASDPQAFRYRPVFSSSNELINADEWNKRTRVYDAIGRERQENYYVPVVVNGDITEFGHGGERRAAQRMFKRMKGRVGGPLILPGLGNHDYDNNVGKCGNNGCARDATCDHIKWVSDIKPKNSFDYKFANATHKGSLSYAVTVGNVVIIQLNNSPHYTRQWQTGGGVSFETRQKFDITSSMSWLEGQLREADNAGRQIIVNMHRRETVWNNKPFADMVNKYRVAAVFAGHNHGNLGKVRDINNVPMFQSGGLLAETYLRVTFDWSKMKMIVDPVSLTGVKRDSVEVALPIKDWLPLVR